MDLVEFDNPPCMFVRDGKLMDLDAYSEVKECAGKTVTESRFTLQPGDILGLVSDGVVYAGVGQALNFGWNWDNVSAWLAKDGAEGDLAPRLAISLSQAVKELYLDKPGMIQPA